MTELDVLIEEFNSELKEIKDKYEFIIKRKISELNLPQGRYRDLISKMGEDFYQVSTELIENVNKRELAEQRLLESEENFRFITENVNDIIIILNKDLKVEYVNELPLNKIAGYHSDDLIDKNGMEYIHPDDLAKALNEFKKSFETGEASTEVRLKHKNGHYVWTEAKGNIILDHEKNPKAHIIVRDISQRKIAEERLRNSEEHLKLINQELEEQVEKRNKKLKESEEKFRTMAENSLIGISITQDSQIKYVNKKNAEIMGYSLDEMQNWDFNDIFKHIFPEDLPRVKKNMEIFTLKSEERSNQIDNQVITKAGKVIWVENISARIHYEGRPARLITTVDITDRKIAEQKLKESEENYRNLFENSPNMILLIDLSGTIVDVNKPFVNTFSLKKQTLIGNKFNHMETLLPKNRDLFTERFKEIIERGFVEPFEVQVFVNEKTIKWMNLQALLFEVEGKKFIQVILQDINERKEAEQKLKESEERFRSLFEVAPASIMVADLDSNILMCNKQFCMVHGFENPELVIGRKFPEFIAEKDRLKLSEGVKMTLGGTSRDIISYTMLKNDGTEFPAEATSSAINDKDGKTIGIIGVAQDITKRKKAEQIVKESEEKYRNIVENSLDGITLTNEQGDVIEWNQGMEEISGFKRDEVLGRPVWDVQFQMAIETDRTTEMKEQLRNGTLQILKEGDLFIPTHIQEQKIQCSNGSHKIVQTRSYSIKTDLGIMIGTIIRDITQRLEAEQIVKESEEKFRTIAEQSFMGVIILQDEKLKYINEAAAKIFEYSSEEVMNWSKDYMVEKSIHPEDLPILREKRELRRRGEFNLKPYISYRVITRSGKIKWIDQFSRIIDYQGKEAELISIIDISDQKEAEKIITEENKMLVELDQMRKDLITRVSHELKTPLVSIFSCSELLIDYYKEQMSEEVMKFVEIIHRGGKRLKDLIKNLLDASQIDAGKLKINKEKANLIELIRNCIDYVKFLVDDRKISLDYDFPQELFLEVDKIRIEQVFTNLLSNALKNTPSNGNIYLNITEEDNHIYTTIKDTGVGFTKKEMNKIFKKFGKIERYGKELDVDIEGSGLGLYISKEIVGLHGGMIWVESEGRNKGATFTIKLPTRK